MNNELPCPRKPFHIFLPLKKYKHKTTLLGHFDFAQRRKNPLMTFRKGTKRCIDSNYLPERPPDGFFFASF
jgi:hypothetical protein